MARHTFLLKALIFGGCSVVIHALPTIHPETDIQVDESSTVEITCSFDSSRAGTRQLSVNGVLSSNVDATMPNVSLPMFLLNGFYTVRALTPMLRVDFRFNATRRLDRAEVRCWFSPITTNIREVSVAITVRVRHPPSQPNVKHEVFPVTIQETSLQFQLNCSDLLTGNPLPDFSWTYDNSSSANIRETGFRNSVLAVKIDSLEQVPELIASRKYVCLADNGLGSVNKCFSLNVSAVPSAPRQVHCESTSKCSVNCTWNEPVSRGSSMITQYNLIVSNMRGEQKIYNKLFTPGQSDYSITDTTFPVYIPNSEVTASISAINDVGPGAQSSVMFIAPGPCMKPDLTMIQVKETSLSVTWTASSCPIANLPLLGFRVTAINVTGSLVFDERVQSNINGLDVGPLRSNTSYIIAVVGINCFGETEPASVTKKTLEDGVPHDPWFEVVSKEAGTITMTWHTPYAGSPNGTIISYTIYYTCGSSVEMKTENICSVLRSYTLTGLGFGVNCSVDMSATNSLGNSARRNSPKKDVVTMKPESPSDVVVCKDGKEPTSQATIAGIAISCFVVGCLLGLTAAVISSRKCIKRSKPAVVNESVTYSSAYASTSFSTGPQEGSYAEVSPTKSQEQSLDVHMKPSSAYAYSATN